MHNENNSAANISPYLLFMIIISYIRICGCGCATVRAYAVRCGEFSYGVSVCQLWLHYILHYKHTNRFYVALCEI